MSEPFIAEIKIVSFTFPPKGWAFCNGQLLPINQNQALFSLLGTVYGGNGQTTFGLPNLQGRIPLHFGNGFTLGEVTGEQNHTLNISEIPTHLHLANASPSSGNTANAANSVLAGALNAYGAAGDLIALNPTTIGNIGGSQPHNNMQPYLVLNFCIALQGIFPSRN